MLSTPLTDLLPKRMFVYGTLRTDLYHRTNFMGLPIGFGLTPGVMYSLGGYPGVVPGNPGDRVFGQVLTFDHHTDEEWRTILHSTDRYEGTPTLYHRRVVEVTMRDGPPVDAHMYFFSQSDYLEKFAIIPSGDWADALHT